MQKLQETINSFGKSFGATQTGVDWCVKALHPSDPLTEVRGIPDHCAVPSLTMNYQSTFKVSPHVNATGTWSFAASLIPHPIQFMYLDYYDSVVTGGTELHFLNQQITGSTHYEKFLEFRQIAQRYRLAYMSVTVYQDGPDLANQGTIVVSQPPVEPRVLNFCATNAAAYTVGAAPRTIVFTAEDLPNYSTSQSMPNAYFGRSREGAYVPLKLTETCQDWRSDRDAVTVGPVTNGMADEIHYLGFSSNAVFPFDILPLHRANTASITLQCEATTDLLNGTWAHICAENLSVQTSFSFFVRCGIEMQVAPNSSLAPQLKLSPPHDAIALETYFAIARELKDGYPADYNDRGKMWDAISLALRQAAPIINAALPGAGYVIGGASMIGDVIRKNRQAKSKSKPNSRPVPVVKPAEVPRRPRRKKKGKKQGAV